MLHISLRDLAPEILLRSQNVVDDVEQVMKADTSPHLAEQLTGNRSFVTGTLAEIMLGHQSVNRSRPIIFSPFGMGILDVAVGKWVYDRAVAASRDLRLDDLAGVAGISTFHFAREFKKMTGASPHQYLMKLRIQRAQSLLKESNLPLIEVGLQSGFSHQSHFTRLFRRFTGTTPQSYRLLFKR